MSFLNLDNIIIVLLLAIIVFGVLVMQKKKDCSENFKKCICSSEQGGRSQQCQDNIEVNNLYVTGKLTENSELKSKGWTSVSPGDIDFPVSNGCGWSNAPPKDNSRWQAWDFTDFGN
jgi:hypothetical protein